MGVGRGARGLASNSQELARASDARSGSAGWRSTRNMYGSEARLARCSPARGSSARPRGSSTGPRGPDGLSPEPNQGSALDPALQGYQAARATARARFARPPANPCHGPRGLVRRAGLEPAWWGLEAPARGPDGLRPNARPECRSGVLGPRAESGRGPVGGCSLPTRHRTQSHCSGHRKGSLRFGLRKLRPTLAVARAVRLKTALRRARREHKSPPPNPRPLSARGPSTPDLHLQRLWSGAGICRSKELCRRGTICSCKEVALRRY